MQRRQVTHVQVWSGRIRLIHALLAVLVTVLLVTGFLFGRLPAGQAQSWLDAHRLTGYLLVFLLAWRAYLFASGSGPERLAACLPRGPQRLAALETLRFYLSPGRTDLPSYYAHNPLWGPIYLATWGMLVLLCVTGIVAGYRVHAAGAGAVALLVVAHVITAVLHDLRGRRGDVSAMINGERAFEVDPASPASPRPGIPVEMGSARR